MPCSAFRVHPTLRPTPRRAAKRPRRREWWRIRPSDDQSLKLRDVQRFILHTKGERREYIYKKLHERWGLVVSDKRFPFAGGVGSFIWMPKYRCYRLQVGASKMTTKRHCWMYAPCVTIE